LGHYIDPEKSGQNLTPRRTGKESYFEADKKRILLQEE
jgi:hypothetical protein